MKGRNERRVLVVGAGIGGLTAAVALRRLGINVTIVEQTKTFGALGAGLTLQPNATAVLAALGVDLPPATVCPIGEVAMLDARGRVLISGDIKFSTQGHPALNIRRPELHDALRAALDDVPVLFQRSVASVVPQPAGTVKVCFHDGDESQWDFVVAADGVHSRVRRALLPAQACEPRYSGQTCWRLVLEAPDLVPTTTIERWSVGRRVGVVPLSRGGIYVYLVQSARAGTVTGDSHRVEAMQQRFAGVDERLDVILERAQAEGVEPHHGDLVDLPVVHFGQGRILLLGDAAHAMTPNLGQGAGMAIEDAAALALLWPLDDLGTLVERFALQRRARVDALQRRAWQVGQMAHWHNRVARWARDVMLRATPRRVLERSMERTLSPGIELADRLQAHLSAQAR